MLELRELVKHFEVDGATPVRAVDGVSLSVAPGEMVALYGPSGSGKSTLLMLVAAVLRPDGGSVLVKGQDVSSLPATKAAAYRMNTLGYLRQSLDVIPGASAIDNAAVKLLGRKVSVRDAHRAVAPVLSRLGLANRLSQRADRLSMGERQRVLIARALSCDPSLVLADEPTGSLDSERGREVLTLLREIGIERSIATLLVTHDPQAAGFADRVLTLRDGKLHEGAPGQDEHVR